MVWGSVISAAASLAGGLMNRSASNDANDANREIASADRDFQMHKLDRDEALQKQFAQEGIRWRVADAKAAGLHPLFAISGQMPSYSPSTFIPSQPSIQPDFSMGKAISDAGQDIGRAVTATMSDTERQQTRVNQLSIERGELENELLRSQIAREKAQMGPPMPSPNAYLMSGPPEAPGNAHPGLKFGISEKPMERTVTGEKPWQEPGSVSDTGYVRTPTGLSPVPSKDAKERIEDMLVPELMWSWRNNVLPSLGRGSPPPTSALPPEATHWEWDIFRQEWQPRYMYGRKNRHRDRGVILHEDFEGR